MTKITMIGEEPQKQLKPIKFIGCVTEYGNSIGKPLSEPREMDEIKVIKVTGYKFDCICVCKKNGNTIIYTANFNDGVV